MDSPVAEGRNGLPYLVPCLHSHAPVDLLVIFLGTNDVGDRFRLPERDVARSVGRLVKVARSAEAGPGGGAPEILVVCPPPFDGHRLGPHFAEMCARARLRAARPRRRRVVRRDRRRRRAPRRGGSRRRRVGGRGARAAPAAVTARRFSAQRPIRLSDTDAARPAAARCGRAVPAGRRRRRRPRCGLGARRAHLGRAANGARRRSAVPRRHRGRADDLVRRHRGLGRPPLHVA